MLRQCSFALLAILCVTFFSSSLFAQGGVRASIPVDKIEAEKWRADLRVLAEEMPKRHQNLFHAMTREQFEMAVKELDEKIPTLAPHQIIVGLGRIVAMAQDGHTGLMFPFPDPKLRFRSYPLTLYIFRDGMFVQAADPEHAGTVGARVLKIGNASADEAYRAVRELTFHDHNNEMGMKNAAPFLLVTPEVLQAVGIVEDMEKAQFTLERDGKQMTVELKPTERVIPQGGHWSNLQPKGWVDMRDVAKLPTPLWLKDPDNTFWYEYLEDSKTVYAQVNGIANKEDETLAQFAERLFAFVDSHAVERLVLDLRWNGGGNNYLNRPLVVGLIKSKINQRGHLFTVTSRRTFSAAQNLVNELEKYTETIFVGEPTGENVNFYGDPARIALPNSGLVVRASGLWWQNMDPRDRRQWTGPEIAAEMTSEDYRNNVDPAMKAILGYGSKKNLTEMLSEALSKNDAALAAKEFREFKNDPANAYRDTEALMNTFGYQLMGAKRLNDAIEVFKLNVEAYPQSSNVYDSLGEAYMNAGSKELAIKNYEKSIELNPQNFGGIEMLKKLRAK
ncbi:MAG: tetratricopeptide repeat protein [Pyrinomonadaceae bacterium]